MRSTRVTAWAASLLIGAWAPTAVIAQEPNDQGVDWRSGGVGASEQTAMREAADEYSLSVTFASRTGAFLAGADVQVKDERGNVVYSGAGLGPILLVDLPRGRYTVEATYEGKTLTHAVTLEGQTRSVTLNWPIERQELTGR